MNKATKMMMMNREHSDGGHKDAGGDYGKREYNDGGYSERDGKEHRDDNHHEPMNYAAAVDKESLTREVADHWMKSLVNEDGTTGPHWTMEQTKQVQSQRNMDCDPLEFWVAMNVVYSDYCGVAKDLNVSNMDFYSKMAKAWLDDRDAVENKPDAYYNHIVKH